jgi:hypothetical protein
MQTRTPSQNNKVILIVFINIIHISITLAYYAMTDNTTSPPFVCKRCGYFTNVKANMKRHFQNLIRPCQPSLQDIPLQSLLEELLQSHKDPLHIMRCKYCNKQFTATSNRYRHQNTCKHKQTSYNDSIIQKQSINNSATQQDNSIVKNTPILDMHWHHGNSKNEAFYQLMLETYLNATHKRLKCGITDITTDTLHAEIKRWYSYKEAIGQLMCYQNEDPKQHLHVYLFSSYHNSSKQLAYDTMKTLNIKVFDMVETPYGIQVYDMDTSHVAFSYSAPH